MMGEIGKTRLDDTPINGQTKRGITSNWAFDEDVTLKALIETIPPWVIDISPFHTPKSMTNWSSLDINTQYIYNTLLYSTGAQNAEIAWDVVLGAGTWSIEIIHTKYPDRGKYSLQLDGVEVGVIDGYNNTTIINTKSTVSGIVISITGKKELKLKMATKNTSASAYAGGIQGVRLTRTA